MNIKCDYKIVAFLGPKGSYSDLAYNKYIKNKSYKIKKNYCKNFNEIFFKLKNKYVNYALVPIENSCSGLIKEVDLLIKKNLLLIYDEISLFINHCLISKFYCNINKINIVYSHNQPFKQCSNFLNKYKHLVKKPCLSTSEAVKTVYKANINNICAIGNSICAKNYSLTILKRNISNSINNITRFILLKTY